MLHSGKQENFILQSGCELKQQLFKFLVNVGSSLNLGHSCKASLLAQVLGQGTTTENRWDKGVWASTPIKISRITFSVFQARCRLYSFSVAYYREMVMVTSWRLFNLRQKHEVSEGQL